MDIRVWRSNTASGWGIPGDLVQAEGGTRPDYRTEFEEIMDDYNVNARVVVESNPPHIHVDWE